MPKVPEEIAMDFFINPEVFLPFKSLVVDSLQKGTIKCRLIRPFLLKFDFSSGSCTNFDLGQKQSVLVMLENSIKIF
jgi:hypothetical protein